MSLNKMLETVKNTDALAYWRGIEAINRLLKSRRFVPNSILDQSLVALAREIADWEQDFYNEKNGGRL